MMQRAIYNPNLPVVDDARRLSQHTFDELIQIASVIDELRNAIEEMTQGGTAPPPAPPPPPGAPPAGGEANTASNIGAGGVGLFEGKVGVDLQFRNINSGVGIRVGNDFGSREVDIGLADMQGWSIKMRNNPVLGAPEDITINSMSVGGAHVPTDLLLSSTASGALQHVPVKDVGPRFLHIQTTPALEWNIIHNLNKDVSVSIYNNVGEQVLADITQVDSNNVRINFLTPQTGKALIH